MFAKQMHTYSLIMQIILEGKLEKWKNNLPLLKELSHVLNHRIAFWDKLHRDDPENQKYRDYIFLYLELFEKSHSYITRKNHYETRKEWQIIE